MPATPATKTLKDALWEEHWSTQVAVTSTTSSGIQVCSIRREKFINLRFPLVPKMERSVSQGRKLNTTKFEKKNGEDHLGT